MNPSIIVAGAIVGFLVGMTGAGGGALMTPMLILLFGVTPSSAISSDLTAAFLMRPIGALIHMKHRTVNFRLAGWLTLGSVPMALLGTYVFHLMGDSAVSQQRIEFILGAALLLSAISILVKSLISGRHANIPASSSTSITVRPLPTLAIGAVGGFVVGLTSVGSGSLLLILLIALYPTMQLNGMVGTDLAQAIPLTFAAALGSLLFGHVNFGITASLVIGSVPAVALGAALSSRAPARLLKNAIFFVVLASGLKYVGTPTALLVAIMGAVAVAYAGWIGFRAAKLRWTGSSSHSVRVKGHHDTVAVEVPGDTSDDERGGISSRPRVSAPAE